MTDRETKDITKFTFGDVIAFHLLFVTILMTKIEPLYYKIVTLILFVFRNWEKRNLFLVHILTRHTSASIIDFQAFQL